jgi:hypothetical protein
MDTSTPNENQEESSTQTPYSEIDMQYDPVDELKKDITKLIKEKNPISLLRKDMIRRRAKKLLKMELRKRKNERIASKISA